MRTLNKLYRILDKRSNKNEMKVGGICHEISGLLDRDIITKEEYDKLDFHFENQKPTDKLHPEFYTTAVRGKFDDMSAYWWDCESRNRENNSATYGRKISSPKLIRTKFIKHMIEFTKDI